MNDNIEFLFRFAERSDVNSLKKLWKTCFGDEDEYIDFFFENRFEPDECLCAFCGGELAGMLFLLPITAVCGEREYSARYIYAVCTEPRFRNRMISTRLLAFAHEYMEKNGVDMSLLVPAEPSLFEYYKKRGFETEFFCREIEIKAEKNTISLEKTELQRLFGERNAVFADSGLYMRWDEKALGQIERECDFLGGETLVFSNGYAVCYPFEDRVFVKEWGARSLDDHVLAAIAEYFGKKTAVVRIPAGKEENGACPFAMTRWYNTERCVNNGDCPCFTLVSD